MSNFAFLCPKKNTQFVTNEMDAPHRNGIKYAKVEGVRPTTTNDEGIPSLYRGVWTSLARQHFGQESPKTSHFHSLGMMVTKPCSSSIAVLAAGLSIECCHYDGIDALGALLTLADKPEALSGFTSSLFRSRQLEKALRRGIERIIGPKNKPWQDDLQAIGMLVLMGCSSYFAFIIGAHLATVFDAANQMTYRQLLSPAFWRISASPLILGYGSLYAFFASRHALRTSKSRLIHNWLPWLLL